MTKYEFDLFDMPSHDPYAPASRGVTRDYVRDLLNRAGSSGWKIVGSIDVHGVSELILMREVEGVAGFAEQEKMNPVEFPRVTEPPLEVPEVAIAKMRELRRKLIEDARVATPPISTAPAAPEPVVPPTGFAAAESKKG